MADDDHGVATRDPLLDRHCWPRGGELGSFSASRSPRGSASHKELGTPVDLRSMEFESAAYCSIAALPVSPTVDSLADALGVKETTPNRTQWRWRSSGMSG